MKFSIVLPVHNEEAILPYILPSVRRLEPNEVVIVFDRCTDKSEFLVDKILKGLNVTKLFNNKKSNWNSHLSFLYDYAVGNTKHRIVLFTQADIWLDPRIKKEIKKFQKGMISFRALFPLKSVRQMIYTIVNLILTNLPFLTSPFTGVFCIDKETYLNNPLSPNDVLEFDSSLLNKVERVAPFRFVKTRCLNFRPWKRERLYDLGRAKAIARKKTLMVLGFSIVRLMPLVLVGYLHEKKKITKIITKNCLRGKKNTNFTFL